MTPVFGQEQGGIGDLGVCVGCGIGDLVVCIGCGGSWSLVSWREKVKRWRGGRGGSLGVYSLGYVMSGLLWLICGEGGNGGREIYERL